VVKKIKIKKLILEKESSQNFEKEERCKEKDSLGKETGKDSWGKGNVDSGKESGYEKPNFDSGKDSWGKGNVDSVKESGYKKSNFDSEKESGYEKPNFDNSEKESFKKDEQRQGLRESREGIPSKKRRNPIWKR